MFDQNFKNIVVELKRNENLFHKKSGFLNILCLLCQFVHNYGQEEERTL